MSEAARNKSILESAYRSWHETRGGSVHDLIEIFSDSISFGSLAEGASPAAFTRHATGRDELRRYFDGLLSGWTMIHYTVSHMIAEDDRVIVLGSTAWTNKATGKVVDTRKADSWRFADGRVIEFYEFYDTAGFIAAATP